MAPTTGILGAAAILALAGTIRLNWKRMRIFQPAEYGLDPVPSEGPIEFAPTVKAPSRVGSALRAWSVERAHADLGPDASAAASAPAPAPAAEPAPELKPEWLTAARTQRIESVAGTGPERKYVEPALRPEPVSEALPKQGSAASGPPPAREERFVPPQDALLSENADYYEILQISPNAEPETIHRVYRIMASRFHPDNPVTGHLERFLQLREAYQTLSDPSLRTAYDVDHHIRSSEPLPVFWQKSFVDGIEGETNRRLGVLSLLYHRRRVSDNKPGVSVMELEQRMAFPREYLNFALWYLRSKGYIALMEDNSDYSITSAGIDFVEGSSAKNRVIRELLTAGAGVEDAPAPERGRNVRRMSPRLSREPRRDAGLRARPVSDCAD